MSYSFSVRAATKADAIAKVAEEFGRVVASQPIHAADRDGVVAAATAFVNMLGDDADKDVCVNVNGSVGWNVPMGPDNPTPPLTSGSVTLYARVEAREVAAEQTNDGSGSSA